MSINLDNRLQMGFNVRLIRTFSVFNDPIKDNNSHYCLYLISL